MVGLLHTDVLVVPPLEAVWLEDDLQLRDGRGCLSFEVKGVCLSWEPRQSRELPRHRPHCCDAPPPCPRR